MRRVGATVKPTYVQRRRCGACTGVSKTLEGRRDKTAPARAKPLAARPGEVSSSEVAACSSHPEQETPPDLPPRMSAPSSPTVLPSGSGPSPPPTSESSIGPSSGTLPAPSVAPTEPSGTPTSAPAASSATPPAAAGAAPATLAATESLPPAGSPPMSEAAPPARASARIAKRKRTTEELAEIRRQKRRLVVHQPAAPSAFTASSPAAEPSSGPCTPGTAVASAAAASTPDALTVSQLHPVSTPKPKQKRARKVVNPTDPVARAAAAAKPAAQPLGSTKKAPARARSTPTSTASASGSALPPPAATSSDSVALPPAARPDVLVLSVDSDSDSDSDADSVLPNGLPLPPPAHAPM